MGKTTLKADTKNAWFYVAVLLSVLQAVQYTGAFIESLSSGTAAIIAAAIPALIFILLALSVLLGAPRGLKKTALSVGLLCIYMAADVFGLITLLRNTLSGGGILDIASFSVISVLKAAVAIGYAVLLIVYVLKCFGKFDTRRPLITAACCVLLLSWALIVLRRIDNNSTVINAICTVDLSNTLLSVPLCITALTLSLKK